jgi:hypothetical protein
MRGARRAMERGVKALHSEMRAQQTQMMGGCQVETTRWMWGNRVRARKGVRRSLSDSCRGLSG